MSIELLERRRDLVMGQSSPYKPLTWVGTSGAATSTINFKINLRWLSTMSFEYAVQHSTSAWTSCFNASVGQPSWASDNKQINIANSSSYTSHDWLYFGTVYTTGSLRPLHDQKHIIGFKNGFTLDGARITTVSSPKSVAEGGAIWFKGYRIWGLKIWNGDELIHDFVPALYGEQYGLWDKVDGVFLASTSTSITGG